MKTNRNNLSNYFKAVLFFIMVATCEKGYTQIQVYANIPLFNTAGKNPNNFVFSYDINNQCMNNFVVINNFSFPTSFNFQILINEIIVYTGSVSLAAQSNVFFNDAFVSCTSSTLPIRIVII
jgi:hypothetical protein